MLTQEKINSNYVIYQKLLEKYGCYSEQMFKEIGENLKNATFSTSADSGSAYQGALIEVIINNLCSIAMNINEKVFGVEDTHSKLYVNKHMLMRVLLLQHIAKAQLFVPTTESWKIKNGRYFEFDDSLVGKLKLGQRSAFLCQKYGIELNETEYEAIMCLDDSDDKGDVFLTPISCLVKCVNRIVATELREKCKAEQTKNSVEA